ncbi:MAG: hypothetical protein CL846_05900 [Crocinitomicaceae bacterium]|nr:hypothetical protein [Crocinitomicaceae bacterium]
MKRCILLIIYLLFIYNPFSAQDVYTKDGIKLGDRSEFINSCIGGFEKETINLKGITINKKNYCSCMCDNLMPQITSEEILHFMKNNDIMSIFMKDKNFDLIMECVEDHMKLEDDYVFKENAYSENQKKVYMKTCVQEFMNNKDDQPWSINEAEEYCECAMKKLYSEGYTFKDLMETDDEDSKVFNEIVVPCISELITTSDEEQIYQFPNTYNINDIVGNSYSSAIELVDYLGQGYKMKIEIDGVVKYFLFDTGASDLVINRNIERDLLINGSINKNSYVGKDFYLLANNEKVEADIVLVNNLKIGNYTLNNVYIAIIDDGGMLCGKGLFDKFRTWEFEEDKNRIIVYK